MFFVTFLLLTLLLMPFFFRGRWEQLPPGRPLGLLGPGTTVEGLSMEILKREPHRVEPLRGFVTQVGLRTVPLHDENARMPGGYLPPTGVQHVIPMTVAFVRDVNGRCVELSSYTEAYPVVEDARWLAQSLAVPLVDERAQGQIPALPAPHPGAMPGAPLAPSATAGWGGGAPHPGWSGAPAPTWPGQPGYPGYPQPPYGAPAYGPSGAAPPAGYPSPAPPYGAAPQPGAPAPLPYGGSIHPAWPASAAAVHGAAQPLAPTLTDTLPPGTPLATEDIAPFRPEDFADPDEAPATVGADAAPQASTAPPESPSAASLDSATEAPSAEASPDAPLGDEDDPARGVASA